MKLLIVEDDDSTRLFLLYALRKFGYEISQAKNGREAWEIFQKPDPPKLTIVDWLMPVMDGIELCKKIRAQIDERNQPYIIILTSKSEPGDTLEALHAGADEFLVKPIDPAELKARVEVGRRIIGLQETLHENIDYLQAALNEVTVLRGFISICSYCKKVRNDDSWEKIENYISEHSEVTFSHGVCPDCIKTKVRPELEAMKKNKIKQPKP